MGIAEIVMLLSVSPAPPSATLECVAGADSDLDGLSDACELALAALFAPMLAVSTHACNWDQSAERLAGGYLFGASPTEAGIRLVYLPAYTMDCGWSGPKCLLRWRGGCDPHVADSEFIVVDIEQLGSDWRATRAFLSAHCFGRSPGDCRWLERSELDWIGYAPLVWVAEGKNANYPSRATCDAGHWLFDTCDRNARSVRFPVQTELQNIGSASAPFPNHTDDKPCVVASEVPLLARGSGSECIWTDPLFKGWSNQIGGGSTGYRRYLVEVAELGP